MTRILVAGVAVADFVFQVAEMPDRPEKYRAENAIITGGGNAANAAVAISRQGGEALLAARLGDDPIGDIILSGLQADGVDTTLVTRTTGALSSFSSIYVDAAGERQIVSFRGRGLPEDADWLDAAPQVDAVLADNRRASLVRKAMALARARGVPAIVDAEAPVDGEALQGASHIAFSKQGLRMLVHEDDPDRALHAAARLLPAWLCVTDGANGVTWLAEGRTGHVPAFPVAAVDTLGAGDIWHGVFALRLAEGAGEVEAIRYANAAAALKCLTHGGRDGAPTRDVTRRFLEDRCKGA